MADIEVTPTGPNRFRVMVSDAGSSTTHVVTIDAQPPSGFTPEELVAASFRFLLDREPKESILREFDLSVISRYFPEYPAEVNRYRG